MQPFRLIKDTFNEELLKTDIYRIDNKYYIEIDIPGVKKEDINVTYENNNLVVFVFNKEIIDKNYIKHERITGEYSRTFYIDNIKNDSIKANYRNGVLKISLEIDDEEIKRKEIKID